MAFRTPYQILEDQEGQELSRARKQFLEWIQPFEAASRYVEEQTSAFRKKLPCGLDNVGVRTIICVALLTVAAVAAICVELVVLLSPGETDILQYVDPLIGTGRGGHVFAGATLPFGMAKPVADVDGENMGGFASDGSVVNGFSHLHDSGTGGKPSMGNFPIFVHPDCNATLADCRYRKFLRGQNYTRDSVIATPGYFSINLESGIRAEMTATEHVALYRFSFTSAAGSKNLRPVVLADGSDLLNSWGLRSMYVNATTGTMTGEGTFRPSFGEGSYRSYFCAAFEGAPLSNVGAFNETLLSNATEAVAGHDYDGPLQGVYARFKGVKSGNHILARVGLSWRSISRACENGEREVSDWNFERVHEEAVQAWRKKLEPIQISSKGVDKKHLRNFWSGVYRAFLNPQDYTGENQLWNSTEPYYDSWYCIWDTFRGVHPFLTLVDPISQSRMVRSLIDIFKHAGYLPECRMSFCKGYTQGGSNADVVLVDGFLKNLPDIDWAAVYEAIVKDAEVQPLNWKVEGRGGLNSWHELSYIPYRDDDYGGLLTRSISRTVEYAYNDFCIAEMANATGRQDDYEKYSRRAGNWKNLFKEDHASMGFTNFPQPRHANGTWSFQNATLCSALNNFDGCYLDFNGKETYEGSPWLYQFYVPGDIARLISLLGGRESFIERLDKLHDSSVLDMGDEQAFLTAFLYHYAGRPGLSIKRVHSYIPSLFNDTLAGIPGNDDSGSMGTFVFFSMLGIFPNAGQSVYFIVPPFFPSIKITNPQTGKTATIRNINFDSKYRRKYVQSAKLDGKPYTKNWVSHDFFENGGTLDLVLGDKEGDWGTKEQDLPPSLSTGLFLG